jgi:hypothetical protein
MPGESLRTGFIRSCDLFRFNGIRFTCGGRGVDFFLADSFCSRCIRSCFFDCFGLLGRPGGGRRIGIPRVGVIFALKCRRLFDNIRLYSGNGRIEVLLPIALDLPECLATVGENGRLQNLSRRIRVAGIALGSLIAGALPGGLFHVRITCLHGCYRFIDGTLIQAPVTGCPGAFVCVIRHKSYPLPLVSVRRHAFLFLLHTCIGLFFEILTRICWERVNSEAVEGGHRRCKKKLAFPDERPAFRVVLGAGIETARHFLPREVKSSLLELLNLLNLLKTLNY